MAERDKLVGDYPSPSPMKEEEQHPQFQNVLVPAGYQVLIVPSQGQPQHQQQAYFPPPQQYYYPPPPPYYPPPPEQTYVPSNEAIIKHSRARDLSNNALVFYILGLFTWLLYLPSLIYSFRLSNLGLVRRKGLLYALSVIELLAWVTVPAVSWIVTPHCYERSYYNNGSLVQENVCSGYWYGWTGIVAWGIAAIFIGIPRLVLSSQYERPLQPIVVSPQPVAAPHPHLYAQNVPYHNPAPSPYYHQISPDS